MAEETMNDNDRECPYCGYKYQPDSEDFHEDIEVEECEECGKKFHSHDSISITHWATPDCSLNGEAHEWSKFEFQDGRKREFCDKCEAINRDFVSVPPKTARQDEQDN